MLVMSSLEMQQEMFELIKNEDESTLKGLYAVMKSYVAQKHMDKMIAEGEEDIEAGRVYSQSEVQKMIEGWVS
ncbi:hypothetical protein [Wenyingzhuangia sp. IMCC45574]